MNCHTKSNAPRRNMEEQKKVAARKGRNMLAETERTFSNDTADDPEDATWGEVLHACCVHSPKEWAGIFAGSLLVLIFLYFFLFGLELLGTGARVLGGCTAGAMFGDDTNPIAGLMIGILATALLQSSSTTTSIVVSLVGAGSVSVKQGIYMIMGANIGTSVTNTIVAVGHLGDGDQLERAFAGATVHDMFNFLAVSVLLPLEVTTGYLFHLTKACVRNVKSKDGQSWESPFKKIVKPLGSKVLISNNKVIKSVAGGESCDDYYPVSCEDPANPTRGTCKVGLIGCDKETGECPAFFRSDATQREDQLSGFIVFVIALFVLFFCLFGLVKVLNRLLLGASSRIIYKATNINGYASMLIGAGITMLIQSSSVTTSALTPLVGMNVLQLEQMYPITLGANIGTTATALLASMVSNSTSSLQVALAHLFFNLTGVLIWYPVPFLRRIPLEAARYLGRSTRIWRGFPIVYIVSAFFVLPLLLLGLSTLFARKSTGLTVLASFLTALLAVVFAFAVHRCRNMKVPDETKRGESDVIFASTSFGSGDVSETEVDACAV